MQKVGEECRNCKDDWKEKKMVPKRMELMPIKLKGGSSVILCPFCDAPAVERAKKRQPPMPA